ncbi:histidinol dehydrogenase [Desulfovibrio sp. JY]|nr:histidinol dehydrogenase [Desulfovibrio sp. JY]
MPCPRFTISGPDDFGALRHMLAGRTAAASDAEDKVRHILNDVATRGDEALIELTSRFDCKTFDAACLRVSAADIAAGVAAVPASDRAIIEEAADNIRTFHAAQKERSWWMPSADGTMLGQIVTPVDAAGCYVPGGRGGETPLISSLLMNAIPAQVAGVPRIVVVSPPRQDGSLNPYILTAAKVLGIDEIYRVGSAWAIAALAYGTASIAPVDVVAGPGNIYVTTAKRMLIGTIGIDMIAGPSEIAILADTSANPDWLAADMLSQAEHDPMAAAVCVSSDEKLLDATCEALVRRLADLPRNDIAAASLAHYGALAVVPDLSVGMELINAIAPEHFELCVADPWALVGQVRHAGAVFMGNHCPEPVGDYFAGPNHVLPTMGTARFSSALSVATFTKKTSLIAAAPGYIAAHGAKIARLARLENLEAHARSVECRFNDK